MYKELVKPIVVGHGLCSEIDLVVYYYGDIILYNA